MKNITIIIFTLLLLMCACTTTRLVEVPVRTIEERYIVKTETDSVIIKDSIDRWRSGDTFFIYKENTKYISKARVDTFIQRDTITEPVIVEKEVKVNYLKWYQKWLMGAGGVGLGLVALLGVHKLTKLKIL